ncbi:MAG: hypothetical protein IPK12_08600 [Gemmatimonadetes bacterium]|nr:hypothetical protein [Gemmatimonadota bacterium]
MPGSGAKLRTAHDAAAWRAAQVGIVVFTNGVFDLLHPGAAVDCVVIFDEDTPLDLIRLLEPDVLVKGGDYTRATTVGADVVEARGGRVKHVTLEPGFSTTALVERLRAPS